jgi:hypothetical protein
LFGRCHFFKVKGGKEDSPMKKRCFILSRWEGENYVIGGETLLPPLLNEHNIEDINVEGEGALGIGGD